MESQTSSVSETSFTTKRLRSIITKGFLVEKIIKDMKKEINFKEEEKDELTSLPSISKKSSRLTSPEPENVPPELKKFNYKELNQFSLGSRLNSEIEGSVCNNASCTVFFPNLPSSLP